MTDKPIYILGGTALSRYLAAKFAEAGKRVVILTGSADKNKLNTRETTIKENFGLGKKHYAFETAAWTREEAKLLLITSPASTLRADLSAVISEKTGNAPALCFTLLKETAWLRDMLGANFAQAVFHGWLVEENRQIIFSEKKPAATIYTPLDEKLKKITEECFSAAKIKLDFSKNKNQIFWQNFSVYAAASLLTAASGKELSQTLKNASAVLLLNRLSEELCALSETDNVKLVPKEIIEKTSAVPAGCTLPLQNEVRNGKTAELNMISSVILPAAEKNKQKIPELKKLIFGVYNTYLSIT